MATRILIVEQFESFRRDIAKYIARLDNKYEVVGEAATDEGAVEQVRWLRPDIVLLDIDLPDRSGLQTTRDIRAIWPATAVIVINSHPETDYRRAALDAGATQCIDKLTLVEQLPGALVAASGALATTSIGEPPEAQLPMPP